MAALMLLMPGTPMLFQGQEFGATTPFRYFADHKPELAAAVRKGRAEFVRQFASTATSEMQERLPAPDDEQTFLRSKLDWSEWERHAAHRQLWADLIGLRHTDDAFTTRSQQDIDGAVLAPEALALRYFSNDPTHERLLLINLGPDLIRPSFAEPLLAPPDGCEWRIRWSSESPEYGGGGTPDIVADGWRILGHSATVLRPEKDT
jgi:maltooligosyltrehalose trehalohydrolase